MSGENTTSTGRNRLVTIGYVVVICAAAAFATTYVAVGIAKPNSRAQHDVLTAVSGVGAGASAPRPQDVFVKPILAYGEQPGGKAPADEAAR